MRAYLDLMQKILEEGEKREDRTGVGTLSLFGEHLEVDLAEGFPLLTTRRLSWRNIVTELMWMLNGRTDVAWLQERGVHIWDQWQNADGTIGPGYGQQFRRIIVSQWVEPQLFSPEEPEPLPFDLTIPPPIQPERSIWLGRVIETGTGPCTVIDAVKRPGHRLAFIVKFHNTGMVREVPYIQVQLGVIDDPWATTVFGAGRYGDYDQEDPYYSFLVDTWREMLRRCYHQTCRAYRGYGAKGVHVAPEWLTFANFQKDARRLPNWLLKVDTPDEYSIDKDILAASNRYSVDTCMWASSEEQGWNTTTNRPFTARSPGGETYLFRSYGEIARDWGLNISAVHRCLQGKLHTHHSWSGFTWVEEPEMVLRTRLFDQVRSLIASLRHDPRSRRHVVSLWNPAAIDRMALPPCHATALQFCVHNDGRLDCHMYQRSADAFLGASYNIASYALLTYLLAHHCGYTPGTLTISYGDLHLYANHLEQARLQLTREPRPLPTLTITGHHEHIWDYTLEDLVLENYHPYPSIKAPVAV